MITLAHKNIHKLQKHKMTHTGEKAHKCHQYLPCVHAPSFKIQMRTHMGEMSYKCSQCKYTCTRVTNLHTHMLTHTEVRAFNCDQCIKIFSRKSYLIKHSLSQAQKYEHKEPFQVINQAIFSLSLSYFLSIDFGLFSIKLRHFQTYLLNNNFQRELQNESKEAFLNVKYVITSDELLEV